MASGDPLLPTIIGQPRGGGAGIASYNPARFSGDLGMGDLARGATRLAASVGAMMEQRDDLAVNRALIDANNERTKYLHEDVLTRQGENAYGGAADFTRRSQDIGARFAATLENDRQRAKFQLMYDRPFGGMYAQAFDYGVREGRRQEDATFQTGMTQNAAALVGAPGSDAPFDVAHTQLWDHARARGWSEKQTKAEWGKFVDSVQMARLKHLLRAGDVAGARAFMERLPVGVAMSESKMGEARDLMAKVEREAVDRAFVTAAGEEFRGYLAGAKGAYKDNDEFYMEKVLDLREREARGEITPAEVRERSRGLKAELRDVEAAWIAGRKRRMSELFDECVRGVSSQEEANERFSRATTASDMRPDDVAAVRAQIGRYYGGGKKEPEAAVYARYRKFADAIDNDEIKSEYDADKWWSANGGMLTDAAHNKLVGLMRLKEHELGAERLRGVARGLGFDDIPLGFPEYLARLIPTREVKALSNQDIQGMMRDYAYNLKATSTGLLWDSEEPMGEVDESEYASGYLTKEQLVERYKRFREVWKRTGGIPSALRERMGVHINNEPDARALDAFAGYVGLYRTNRGGRTRYYLKEQASEADAAEQRTWDAELSMMMR